MFITLQLDMPPSINNYYGTKKGGFAKFIKDDGIAFRWHVLSIKNKLNISSPLDKNNTKLKLTIEFIFNNNRVNDIDNRVKPLFDALQSAGILDNDCNIFSFSVTKKIDKSLPASITILSVEEFIN